MLVETDSHQNLLPPPYDPVPQPSIPLIQPKASAPASLQDDGAGPLPEVVARLLSSFITPATNYISIYQKHLGLKDSWTINTALRPPLGLLARSWIGERKNLDVYSRHGAVDAKVKLACPPENYRHRATLQVGSHHGTVQVYILRSSPQPFHLKASSKHGKVWVHIPRDFHGLVEHNGKTTFSTAVLQKATSFTNMEEKGKTFIGDWRIPQPSGSAFTSPSGWGGDRLEMSSKHGTLYVHYIDEERKEQTLLSKSFWNWFTSSLCSSKA